MGTDATSNATVVMATAALSICQKGSKGGMFLPLGGDGEQEWNKNMRAFLYLVGLLYMFMAVNVGSDYFMQGIERITSARKRVMCKERERKITKMVWNETVANLSLLALGSSAPEILLSCIEIAGNSFYSGELGPSTIVGSAAFNLLVIIAVCILSIPDGQVRWIKTMPVYHVTVVLSLFAYIWLLLIVNVMSPDIITIAEALVTLIMFVVLIGVCFIADIGKLECLALEREPPGPDPTAVPLRSSGASLEGDEAAGPAGPPSDLRSMVSQDPHGKHHLQPRTIHPKIRHSAQKLKYEPHTIGHGHAHLHESSGGRRGSLTSATSGGSRHEKLKEKLKDIEEQKGAIDEELGEPAGANDRGLIRGSDNNVIENRNGVITFRGDEKILLVKHMEVEYEAEVLRRNGTHGRVVVNYSTYPLTAVEDFEYERVEGELVFGPGEDRKVIPLRIMGKQSYSKSDAFQLVLEGIEGGAEFNPNDDGSEEEAIMTIILQNECDPYDDEVPAMEKCMAKCFDIENMKAARQAYREQLANIFIVDGEDGESAGALDYITHVVSFPWKALFAIVSPPANLAGGWLLFFCALFWIGFVTAIISDLASLFGCCAGMEDSITAITLVALGTSLPDTFASMTSAKQDDHADASVVNVTGSNSVNVFLGIGLPWTIASLYWSSQGPTPEWQQRYPDIYKTYPDGGFVVQGGNLGFSVTVFCAVAVVALSLLRIRRRRYGGELGGPRIVKRASGTLLILLWLVYVAMSAWQVESKSAEAAQYPLIGFGVFAFVGMLANEIMMCTGKGRAASERGDSSKQEELPAQTLGKHKEDAISAAPLKITVDAPQEPIASPAPVTPLAPVAEGDASGKLTQSSKDTEKTEDSAEKAAGSAPKTSSKGIKDTKSPKSSREPSVKSPSSAPKARAKAKSKAQKE